MSAGECVRPQLPSSCSTDAASSLLASSVTSPKADSSCPWPAALACGQQRLLADAVCGVAGQSRHAEMLGTGAVIELQRLEAEGVAPGAASGLCRTASSTEQEPH